MSESVPAVTDIYTQRSYIFRIKLTFIIMSLLMVLIIIIIIIIIITVFIVVTSSSIHNSKKLMCIFVFHTMLICAFLILPVMFLTSHFAHSLHVLCVHVD
jgi:hypothetical protein